MESWKYYNHAMIPSTAPHKTPDLSVIQKGTIWKLSGKGGGIPLFARWTTEFDCGYPTQWWYCIKDTPFDICELKSKLRYKINLGKRNFNVQLISPASYADDFIRIQKAAWETYPKAYRPNFRTDKKQKKPSVSDRYLVFGAFGSEDKRLHGYALVEEHPEWADIAVLKVEPAAERLRINAAIVAGICEHYNDRLGKHYYLCEGERNIVHETAFQKYLIENFGFRKAYCKLNLSYRRGIGIAVKMLYPFRHMIAKWKDKKLFNRIHAVLKMEGYCRMDRKNNLSEK